LAFFLQHFLKLKSPFWDENIFNGHLFSVRMHHSTLFALGVGVGRDRRKVRIVRHAAVAAVPVAVVPERTTEQFYFHFFVALEKYFCCRKGHFFFCKKRLPGVGSEPGSSQFH
jgi:hypothetical protein